MTRKLTTAEGLEILALWLEDNVNCESDLCFDDPEIGTDSEMLLPCVQAALKLVKATMTTQPESALCIRAQGDANSYVLLKEQNWFAHVLMNGEMTVQQQEMHLKAMIAGVRNED
ncbi:hypothetical protein D3C76_491260 [compost metagenome]